MDFAMGKESVRILEKASDKMLKRISPEEMAEYVTILKKFISKVESKNDPIERKRSLEYQFGSTGNNLLHLAAKFGEESSIKKLLELSQDPSYVQIKNRDLFTPLHFAAMSGLPIIVKSLIENGAKIDEPSSLEKRLWTPSHFAAKYNSLDALKLLVENGADKEIKTSFGLTPLTIAAEHGSGDIIKFLIENGADVNVQTNEDNHQMTALHYAAVGGFYDVVIDLLNAGSTAEALTSSQVTAIEFAAEKNFVEIVTLLMNYGVKRWKSALKIAQENDAKEVVAQIKKFQAAKACLFNVKWLGAHLANLKDEISQFDENNLSEAKVTFGNGAAFNAYALSKLENSVGLLKKNKKSWQEFLQESGFSEVKEMVDKLSN